MPLPGLSLAGFMLQHEAVQYFAQACIFRDATPAALTAHWESAKERLGHPIVGAGKPTVLPIAMEYHEYLRRVEKNPHFKLTVGEGPWTFELVEIDPLLSFQFHVAVEAATGRWPSRTRPPTLSQMLRKCLPLRSTAFEECQVSMREGQLSFQFRNPDLNMGALQARIGTVKRRRVAKLVYELGIRSPFVQVAHVGGRYYLKNGFHRAFALGRLGVTHIPCIVLQPGGYEEAGLAPGFARHLLDSANPPTCGHFVRNRAYPVTLRRLMRVTEIVCSDYAVPVE